MSVSPRRLSPEPVQNDVATTLPLFTGNKDTDMEILTILDDKSLGSMCRTDRYIRSLCLDDELWKSRMERYYPGAVQFRDRDETWRKFYIIISNLTLDTEGANWAAGHGYLSALKYLASLEPPVYIDEGGLFEIVEHSTSEVLEWVLENTALKLNQEHIELAIEVGNYDVFEWIMEKRTDPILYDVRFDFGYYDDEDDRFVMDNKFIYYSSEELAKYAIKYGRLNMLISILQKYPYIIQDQNNIDVVIEYHYHDVSSLIEATSNSGHLDIIEWGYYNLVNGKYETGIWNSRLFITKVVSKASSTGRLHILDWIIEFIELYRNRSTKTQPASKVDEKGPGELGQRLRGIMSSGILENRIEVVEWALSKNIGIDIDLRHFIEISRGVGNIQMADYLESLQ